MLSIQQNSNITDKNYYIEKFFTRQDCTGIDLKKNKTWLVPNTKGKWPVSHTAGNILCLPKVPLDIISEGKIKILLSLKVNRWAATAARKFTCESLRKSSKDKCKELRLYSLLLKLGYEVLTFRGKKVLSVINSVLTICSGRWSLIIRRLKRLNLTCWNNPLGSQILL